MNDNIEIKLDEQEQTTLEAIKSDIMRDVRNEIAKNNDNNFFIIILKINTRINKRSASAERLKIYV